MAIKTVGLVVNCSKWQALQFAPEVIAWITERYAEVRVDTDSAKLIGRDDLAATNDELAGTDLIITLGGDGTILTTSHFAAPQGTPILGVHMGRFGFITEAHPDELLPALDDVLEGRFEIEERMMVCGTVLREGVEVYTATGLNDIVINKGATARMLHVQTSFGGDVMTTYPADGVIVATPTGSTAYALSAGGPLVEPTVQALLVVPVCPHTLAARPLVVPCDEVITLTVGDEGSEVLFIADSGHVFPLLPGDQVEIRRADYATRIVILGKASFYKKVRQRLLWGERLNL